jgi:hypothetical protein
MFDVQARGRRDGDLPEEVRASIAGYYARVTTAARPMNRLVALAMVATLAALVVQIARGGGWVAWVSLALLLVGVGLAAGRVVPNAVRLGTRRDEVAVQSALARSILRDHVVCFAAIAGVIVLQLAAA